jgi:hypothetical protein
MSHLRGFPAVMLSLALCGPTPAFAAEPVGEATLIRTEVTGASGPLVVRAPVHRDERIRTSISGLGQFIFRDGTKLAVGAGSSVVIDNYVYDDANSAKRLTIKAAKGTFRWISGNSSSSAYSIVTPAGTIGVRGTAFDFYVGPNGTTAMVLLSGAAQFCGAGGCKQLRRQCDCVIATRGGGVSDPRAVDGRTLRALGNQRALPFLSGNQQLSGALAGIRTSCGLASLKLDRKDPVRQQPDPPPPPIRNPPAITPPSPAPPSPAPQDEPTKPHHDKPHPHDRDKDHHWGQHERGHDDRDGPHWGNRSDWGRGDDGRGDHEAHHDRPGANGPGGVGAGGIGRDDHIGGNGSGGDGNRGHHGDKDGARGAWFGGNGRGKDQSGSNGFGAERTGGDSATGEGASANGRQESDPKGQSNPGDTGQADGSRGSSGQADSGQRSGRHGGDRHGSYSDRGRDHNSSGD